MLVQQGEKIVKLKVTNARLADMLQLRRFEVSTAQSALSIAPAAALRLAEPTPILQVH